MARFATLDDALKIQQEMPWEDRDVPQTMYQFLTRTAEKFGSRPAFSYQLFSGADDPAQNAELVAISWQSDTSC